MPLEVSFHLFRLLPTVSLVLADTEELRLVKRKSTKSQMPRASESATGIRTSAGLSEAANVHKNHSPGIFILPCSEIIYLLLSLPLALFDYITQRHFSKPFLLLVLQGPFWGLETAHMVTTSCSLSLGASEGYACSVGLYW